MSKSKAAELALTVGLSLVIAFGAASGFSTPKAKLEEHETRIHGLEDSAKQTAIGLGRMDQKLDDLVNGLGVPRRHPGAYRP